MKPIQAAVITQSTIVLPDAQKDLLAAAMRDAKALMEKSAHMDWKAAAPSAEEKRANERAERIAWLVDSL